MTPPRPRSDQQTVTSSDAHLHTTEVTAMLHIAWHAQ